MMNHSSLIGTIKDVWPELNHIHLGEENLNNFIHSPYNTKHICKELPSEYSQRCIKSIDRIGIV